jgi:dynein heavy chain 1
VVYEGLSIPPTHREAVINAFVFVHQTLHQANARLAKRGGRCMAITPRHYLDFINHYVSFDKFLRRALMSRMTPDK